MTNGADEIRKQVQERVDQEAAQIPPQDEKPKITSQLIQECLFCNELGDGLLFATIFRDRYLYCKNTAEWYEWTGHSWKLDRMNHSLADVEKIVEHYLAEFRTLSGKITDLVAGRYTVEWHQVMAATVLATLPVSVLFAWLQRYLVKGLALGAVK